MERHVRLMHHVETIERNTSAFFAFHDADKVVGARRCSTGVHHGNEKSKLFSLLLHVLFCYINIHITTAVKNIPFELCAICRARYVCTVA